MENNNFINQQSPSKKFYTQNFGMTEDEAFFDYYPSYSSQEEWAFLGHLHNKMQCGSSKVIFDHEYGKILVGNDNGVLQSFYLDGGLVLDHQSFTPKKREKENLEEYKLRGLACLGQTRILGLVRSGILIFDRRTGEFKETVGLPLINLNDGLAIWERPNTAPRVMISQRTCNVIEFDLEKEKIGCCVLTKNPITAMHSDRFGNLILGDKEGKVIISSDDNIFNETNTLFTAHNSPILSLTFQGHYIVTCALDYGHSNQYVKIFDNRNTVQPLKIRKIPFTPIEVHFHPQKANFICAVSREGEFQFFDINESEDDYPISPLFYECECLNPSIPPLGKGKKKGKVSKIPITSSALSDNANVMAICDASGRLNVFVSRGDESTIESNFMSSIPPDSFMLSLKNDISDISQNSQSNSPNSSNNSSPRSQHSSNNNSPDNNNSILKNNNNNNSTFSENPFKKKFGGLSSSEIPTYSVKEENNTSVNSIITNNEENNNNNNNESFFSTPSTNGKSQQSPPSSNDIENGRILFPVIQTLQPKEDYMTKKSKYVRMLYHHDHMNYGLERFNSFFQILFNVNSSVSHSFFLNHDFRKCEIEDCLMCMTHFTFKQMYFIAKNGAEKKGKDRIDQEYNSYIPTPNAFLPINFLRTFWRVFQYPSIKDSVFNANDNSYLYNIILSHFQKENDIYSQKFSSKRSKFINFHEVFGTEKKAMQKCTECHTTDKNFKETSSYMSIHELKIDKHCSNHDDLEECFRKSFGEIKTSKNDNFCEKCKMTQRFELSNPLSNVSQILIFNVSRDSAQYLVDLFVPETLIFSHLNYTYDLSIAAENFGSSDGDLEKVRNAFAFKKKNNGERKVFVLSGIISTFMNRFEVEVEHALFKSELFSPYWFAVDDFRMIHSKELFDLKRSPRIIKTLFYTQFSDSSSPFIQIYEKFEKTISKSEKNDKNDKKKTKKERKKSKNGNNSNSNSNNNSKNNNEERIKNVEKGQIVGVDMEFVMMGTIEEPKISSGTQMKDEEEGEFPKLRRENSSSSISSLSSSNSSNSANINNVNNTITITSKNDIVIKSETNPTNIVINNIYYFGNNENIINQEEFKNHSNMNVTVEKENVTVTRKFKGAPPNPAFKNFTGIVNNNGVANTEKGIEFPGIGRITIVNLKDEKIIEDRNITLKNGEIVKDYFTQFSGLSEGDLVKPTGNNKSKQSKNVKYWSLKELLVQMDILIHEKKVIFVGHGLTTDFLKMGFFVPASQIIDTSLLYRLPHRRFLSLKFLSFYLIGARIQMNNHCSHEDSTYAVKLFKIYKTLLSMDQLIDGKPSLDSRVQKVINELYYIGEKTEYKVLDENFLKNSTIKQDSEKNKIEDEKEKNRLRNPINLLNFGIDIKKFL